MIQWISDKIEATLVALFDRLDRPTLENRVLLGKLMAEHNKLKPVAQPLSAMEFKVFSQNGEDGIIQHLLTCVPIEHPTFIEFGVGDYREANTRFLLWNNNWKGLVIDSQSKFIKRIRSNKIYWNRNLTACESFITKDNVNDLFLRHGYSGDIGLLSIDIDGNDYWIWEAITVVQPRIVICEYNSVFGKDRAVTIPYQASFDRTASHYSNLYFGTSLKSLCLLAQSKGYIFVGSDSSGTNAFFVRKDVAKKLKPISCEQGYVESMVRESRDINGTLTFVSGTERLKLIAEKQVFDIETQKLISLEEIIEE